MQIHPLTACEWCSKESSDMPTTPFHSIYRSSSSSPVIPWELLSFSPTASELILRTRRPYAFVSDCFVLSSSAPMTDNLAEGKMGMKLWLKGRHQPEAQNTNHHSCQGCSGRLWHLPLFSYSSFNTFFSAQELDYLSLLLQSGLTFVAHIHWRGRKLCHSKCLCDPTINILIQFEVSKQQPKRKMVRNKCFLTPCIISSCREGFSPVLPEEGF